jgi:putative MATE family efflux protein
MASEAPSSRPRVGVWQLAWPAVVTNLLQSMVGLVDTKAVGSLGPASMAASTAGHRLQFVLQALLLATSAGTTALVARAWGAGDREEAARVVGASLVVGMGIAAVMAIAGMLAAEPFAVAFGLQDETARLASTYIRWISGFNLVFAVAFVIGSGVRATGDTRTPLAIGAITNVVNVGALYLFVYGGLGAPKLGIAGAALSFGMAFAVGTAFGIWLFVQGKLDLQPVWTGLLERARLMRLVRVSYPAALEQLVFQIGFVVFTYLMASYGTPALAAYGIGVQILSLSFVVGFGFSIAASTLVGQNLGARDTRRAASSGWRAMRYAVLSMSVLSVLIVSLARPIAQTMIDDPEVVRLTVVFIYILGAMQPLMAIDFALSGALRGAGDTRFPLLTTFVSLICGRVLLALLFKHLGLRVEWIYGALIADYIVKASLLTWRFRSGRWQHALPEPTRSMAAESDPAPAAAK